MSHISSNEQISTIESSSEAQITSNLPQHYLIDPTNRFSGSKTQSYSASPQENYKKELEDRREKAISMASAFFGCANRLETKETINRPKLAIEETGACVERNKQTTINFPAFDQQSLKHEPINSTISNHASPILTSSSQITSSTIAIPNDHSFPPTSISHMSKSYTPDSNELYRSMSSPAGSQSASNAIQNGDPPSDIIDPTDGHIWRAKYCILENGILYFYRNELDANMSKAKTERTENSLFHSSQSSLSSPSPYKKSVPDSLSTSPIPRPIMATMFNDPEVIWEKRVALDCVGAVRSAEDEHGKYSFVLMTPDEGGLDEDQDCLVLRSGSTEEMQEWLFQIHRSLASIVKEMVFHHPTGPTGSTLLSPQVHYPLVGITPQMIPVDKRMLISNQTSISYSPRGMHIMQSLSHGHGRNDMHRRRVREKATGASRSRTSSFDSCDTKSELFSMFENESTDAPFELVDDASQESPHSNSVPNAAMEENKIMRISPKTSPKITKSIDKTTSSDSTPSVGKYVPPHLRNKMNGKYVPPHLRNKQLNTAPLEPAALEVRNDDNFDKAVEEKKDYTAELSELSYSNRGKKRIGPLHFKLGGCADKDIGDGSIMDPAYKKRSVKLGKGQTITYGFKRKTTVEGSAGLEKKSPLNWEVGSVSACGVRSSNEDAYVIANDLMHVLEKQTETGEDYRIQESTGESSRGLFAVFDGHCGFQTARYAAEKITSFLLESIEKQNDVKEEEKIDNFFSKEENVLEGLYSAITSLDKDFCERSNTDGREWGDCGATALVTVLSDEKLYVANLGDCRGILCASCYESQANSSNLSEKDGWLILEDDDNMCHDNTVIRSYWKEVTDIHNPSRQDEKERIEAANGWTTTEQEICFGQIQRMDLEDKDALDIVRRWFSHRFAEYDQDKLEFGGNSSKSSSGQNETKKKKYKAAPGRLLTISRICGELGVSRALGDKDFKSAFNTPSGIATANEDWWEGPNYLPYPENHNYCFKGDLVSSTPEFQVLNVGSEGVINEFLILACDGLWDVIDADDAARIARNLMFEKGWSAESSVRLFILILININYLHSAMSSRCYIFLNIGCIVVLDLNIQAARLAELAIHLGSSDNITVILIRFFR